jgi:formate/nitrite transporter FocA (FNT family)
MADDDGREKLTRTPLRAVAVAAMIGAIVAFMFFGTVENLGQTPPRVPMVTWLIMAFISAITGVLAAVTHHRVQRRHQLMEPGRAVALLVLGKTALMAGAALAGAYLTIVILYLPRIAAPTPAERVVNSAIAAVFAIGLAVAGWFLERACVVPGLDDSDDSPS